jgi:hypothetical protein
MIILEPPKIKTEDQIKQQKEFKFVGSFRLVRGLKLWSFNLTTKKLKEVEIDRQISINYLGKTITKNKAFREKDCIYCQALNKKNAIKKFYKWVLQNSRPLTNSK